MQRFREEEKILSMLVLIEEKEKNNEILTDEELRFLYEIDEVIYTDDKRFQLILDSRDRKKDLARIFKCSEDMISLDSDNVLEGQIYYMNRKFIYNSKSMNNMFIPRATIVLHLVSLESANDLVIPENVVEVYLNDLISADGLVLSDSVVDIYLKKLKDAKGLILTKNVRTVSFGDLSETDNYEISNEFVCVKLDDLFLFEKLKFLNGDNYIGYKRDLIKSSMLADYFSVSDDKDISSLRYFMCHLEAVLRGEKNKSLSDFCMLHDIIILQKNDGPLSNEGLRFLYEMDSSIYKNSKIMNTMYERIITKRNRKEDLAKLFNCSEDMISIDKGNVLGNQIYYDGYTFVYNGNNGIIIPKATKELYLNGVEDIKGIVIPEGVLVVWYKEKKYSKEEFLDLQKKSMYRFNGTPKNEYFDPNGGPASRVLKPDGFVSNTIILTNIILFGILSFIITLLILK